MAVASFIEFCRTRNIVQSPDKIVKNLCTFLCQDVEQTPTFALAKVTERGIFSSRSILQADSQGISTKNGNRNQSDASDEDVTKAKISRRGAELAFMQLSSKFGDKLFERVPKMWEFMAGGLLAAFTTGTSS